MAVLLELTAQEAGRQRLFPMKCNVVEGGCQSVPAGARSRFGAHDMRLGRHFHSAPAKWPVHQADLDRNRRSRLNPLRAEEENSAGTDVGRSQRIPRPFALARDALHTKWQAELGSSVSPPFFRRANGMGGNPGNAFRLGSRRPRRQVGNRSCRTGRQFFDGGIAAAGIGLVHKLLISNNAHRSPSDTYASGTARGHYPLPTSPRQFRFPAVLS